MSVSFELYVSSSLLIYLRDVAVIVFGYIESDFIVYFMPKNLVLLLKCSHFRFWFILCLFYKWNTFLIYLEDKCFLSMYFCLSERNV